MNQKHLSALLLVVSILVAMMLSQKLNQRLEDANQVRMDAEFALSQERNTYNQRNIAVETMKQDSVAMREYLGAWLPKLKDTDDETKANNAFSRVMKQAGQQLIPRKNTSKLLGNEGNIFITKRLQSLVSMEGDYIMALTFLAQLEKQMPASRVTSYNMAKGTSQGNNVVFSFTLDTPVLNIAAAPTDKPAKL